MSANNYNFVCFRCRTALRYAKAARRTPKCLTCGQACFCLGHKVEVPKHADVKAWTALETECQRREQESIEQQKIWMVRRRHGLEREIQRLSVMPANRDRARQIKKLKDQL